MQKIYWVMNRHLPVWIVALILLSMPISLIGGGFPLRIAIMADPHLFPQELNPKGAAFERYVSNDRKLLAESEAILESAIRDILKHKPDMVLIPGDLTKDAERIAHERMVEILEIFSRHGIPVFVVPGNHDILNPHAFRYEGDARIRVPTISPEEFSQLYWDFGYGQALQQDPHSLSYLVEPVPWLWVLCIDSAIYEDNKSLGYPVVAGRIRGPTLQWILEIMEEAEKQGKRVIAQLHHGVVAHFEAQPLAFPEWLIEDWEETATILADAGLSIVFTGHFHAQDVSLLETEQGNRIFDILTGSLVTFPNPWRMVEITEDFLVRIASHRITEIDFDTQGMPFAQYSEEMLVRGLLAQTEWLAIEFFERMGNDPEEARKIAQTFVEMRVAGVGIADIAVNLLKRVLQGDQRPDFLTGLAAQVLVHSEHPVFQEVGQLLQGLAYDTFPPDNNLTICWNTREVIQ